MKLLNLQSLLLSVFLIALGGVLSAKPNASRGVMDIRSYSFDNDGSLALSGEWELYWNRLLWPDSFASGTLHPDTFFSVPGVWNEFYLHGKRLPSKGYVTLRLNVLLTPQKTPLSLQILTFATAGRLFINGKEVYRAGTVGTDDATSKPAYRPQIVDVEADTSRLELVLQVSNFHHRKGGVWRNIKIGTHEQILSAWVQNKASDALLLGSILIITLYNLIHFLVHRVDKAPLLFALFCWTIGLRLLSTGYYALSLLPGIGWKMIIIVEYSSAFMAVPLIVAFLRSLFPEEMSALLLKVAVWVSASLTMFVIVAPVEYGSYTTLPLQVLILSAIGVSLWALTKAVMHKRPGSWSFLVGVILFCVIAVNDVLHSSLIIQSRNLIPIGAFALILSQATALSFHIAKSYEHARYLSKELNIINRSLESLVRMRTSEIEQQKEEIQTQADALRDALEQLRNLEKFKENLTGMIVHDLKTPLSAIIFTSERLMTRPGSNFQIEAQKIHYRSKQMLNMVYNILDVQKHEEARMNLDKTYFFVDQVVEDALVHVSFLADEKNVSLQPAIPSNARLYADPAVIERVMINLLTNAIKYTAPNTTIKLSVVQKDGLLRLNVTDQGPGVPEHLKEYVFSKFGTIVSRDSNLMKSTGIGLTFCKIAIEAHEGHISFDSEIGKGTTFWFVLPDQTEGELNQPTDNENLSTNRPSIVLDENEKALLTPYAEDLKKHQVFEISAIRRIIRSMPESATEGITKWKQMLEKCLYISDENAYRKLLEYL